jgi:SAM-dependent methyltransferase/nucleoside phosphorylase
MQGQNAVNFDFDMAIGYDVTRPFCPKEKLTQLFYPIFEELTTSIGGANQLRIFDAGCGTGRISIPLLQTYEEWRSQRTDSATLPDVRLVAVDTSLDMIRHFQKNMTMAGIRTDDPRIRLRNWDIREAPLDDLGQFDLIIAHWLFHTILDWRTAALRLDAMAADNGYILALQETSPYYDALDGDLSDTEGRGRTFWTIFHAERKGAIKNYKDDGRFLPPSMRLGPKVSDERVSQMLCAFGWKEIEIGAPAIEYAHSFTNLELIELVTFGRAFTNLRIGASQAELVDLYSRVAQHLKDELVDFLHSEVKFPFSVGPRLFKKQPDRRVKASLILDMVRDTISARRSHSIFDLYNRSLLWERLFATVLPRLSKPSPAFDLFGDQLEFTIAVPPYNRDLYCNGLDEETDGNLADLWRWLVGNVETDDVVHIARLNEDGTADVTDGDDPRMVPYESSIALDEATWSTLVELGQRWRTANDDALVDNLPSETRTVLCRQAMRAGVIGYQDDDSKKSIFLGALARLIALASVRKCEHIYLLPVRKRFVDSAPSTRDELRDHSTFGMLVGSQRPLTYSTISLLWLVVDLLIIDYHDQTSGNERNRAGSEPVDPWNRKAERALPQWRKPGPGRSFEPIRVKGPCDLLVLSINPRENRAIDSCFSGGRPLPAGLPKAWKTPNGLKLIHAKIGKGRRCPDDVISALDAYSPRVVILSGTMGGAWPEKHAFADVVIATQVLAHDEVDEEPEGVLRPQEDAFVSLPPTRAEWLRNMTELWNTRPFSEKNGLNKAFAGPILSGRGYKGDRAKLLKFINDLRLEGASIPLGYEMEAAEFCREARSHKSHPAWAVVKGISDFADKHNYYQAIAAFRAAEFIRFLCDKSNPATNEGILAREFLDDGMPLE